MNPLNPLTDLRRFNFPMLTNVVFKQFTDMLGGRCRLFVTGSAPLSQQHAEFMAICFNCHIFEGFGMSETSAHGGVQSVHTVNFGNIGEGLDLNTSLRIKSVPEMGYHITDMKIFEMGGVQENVCCPRGELLIKGPSVFKGYYNDPQKTQESFDNGFFLTGDIAEYNPVTKEVKLIDRKRGIVKLSQGEFISINQIEDAISKTRSVESCFLYANRFHPFTVCVIVPNRQYLAGKGIKADDLSVDQAAIAFISNEVKQICK